MKFSILRRISLIMLAIAAGAIEQISASFAHSGETHSSTAIQSEAALNKSTLSEPDPAPIIGDGVLVQTRVNLFPKIIANASLEGEAGVSHKGVDWVGIDAKAEQALYDRVKREGIGYNKANAGRIGGPNASITAAMAVNPGKGGKWEGPYDRDH